MQLRPRQSPAAIKPGQHPGLGEELMRADDLQQLELVGHDTTGFQVFGGHRMMVTGTGLPLRSVTAGGGRVIF